MMLSMMNVGHRTLEDWGLQFAEIAEDASVLDCGCGGGANIKKLLKMCPNGEVKGVLKPDGIFLICNECGGDNEKDEKWTEKIDGMTIYKDVRLKEILEQAGFRNIQIHKSEKGWLCITAKKRESEDNSDEGLCVRRRKRAGHFAAAGHLLPLEGQLRPRDPAAE